MMYLPKKVSRCFGRREAPAIAATFALSSSPSWLSRFLLRRVERRERRWGCVFSGAASAAPAASRDALTWYAIKHTWHVSTPYPQHRPLLQRVVTQQRTKLCEKDGRSRAEDDLFTTARDLR